MGSDIPAGDGKNENFFYSVYCIVFEELGKVSCGGYFGWAEGKGINVG